MPNRSRIRLSIFLALFLVWFTPLWAAPTISLTASEQEFIADHQQIRVGIDPMFVPFEFINAEGKHGGISADVLES